MCRALERLVAGPSGASILPEFVSHARPGLQSVRPNLRRPNPNRAFGPSAMPAGCTTFLAAAGQHGVATRLESGATPRPNLRRAVQAHSSCAQRRCE